MVSTVKSELIKEMENEYQDKDGKSETELLKQNEVRLKDENGKLRVENVHYKKRIKREEEVRKHW